MFPLALALPDLRAFTALDWTLTGVGLVLLVGAIVTPFALLSSLWELRLQAHRTNEFLKTLAAEMGKLRNDTQAATNAVGNILAEMKTDRELFEKNAGKALVFLRNLDAETDHTNKLLEWIGQERGGAGAAPEAEGEQA